MASPKTLAYCTLVFFFAASSLLGQQKSAPDLEKSCQDFVQGFYDWYVPKTQFDQSHKPAEPPLRQPLKERTRSFSLELRHRLIEDFEAQAKARGELVGLDFDPFLNGQDPSVRFVAETISRKGGSYWVEVYGMSSGQRQEHVVPELVFRNGRWVFVNFHYGKGKFGGDSDLLSILKTLRDERQKFPN
jgi:hypothetical protein